MFDTWFIFFNYILSIIGIHLNWPMTGFELETFGTESDHLGNFLQVLVHYCWQIIWKKGLDINLMKWNIVCRGGMPRAESDKRILWPLPDLAAPKNISRKSLNWVGGGSLWHKLELTFWHTHSAPPPPPPSPPDGPWQPLFLIWTPWGQLRREGRVGRNVRFGKKLIFCSTGFRKF